VAVATILLAVVASSCASDAGSGDTSSLPFVGQTAIPADLSAPMGDPGDADALGTDDAQGALATACQEGDYRSCDDLYQRGAPGSTYAGYAFSCGGRLNPPPGEGQAPNCRLRSIDHVARVGGPPVTGDSPTLDRIAQECGELGGVEACDTLFRESPQHTDYADYAVTCGFRAEDTRPNACAGFDGVPDGRPLGRTGDDPELDQLAEECFQARISSCDELYASSDRGSVYETYAQTCGGRLAVLVERVQPSCDLRFNDPVPTGPAPAPNRLGDQPELDDLANACAEGAMRSCDELFARSDLNTDYENYGATCGGRFAAQRRDLQFSAAGECEARVMFVPEAS
jgi:hypothetical protein